MNFLRNYETKKRNSINPSQRGFTLIELLVVIAIVGLLASIIIVSLNNRRTAALIAGAKQFSSQMDRAYGADAAGIWNFNDASGTAVTDFSQYKSTGTVLGTGATWITPDATGSSSAISLTPSSAVFFPYNSGMDSPTFTISFWIKPGPIVPGGCCSGIFDNIIMGRENYTVAGFRMALTTGGLIELWTTQSGGTLGIVTTKPVASDRFYHVAFTYANGQANAYVDGHLAGSATGTYINPPGGYGLTLNGGIGGTASATASYDDVRFYTQSLLASDIQKIYAESKSKYVPN